MLKREEEEEEEEEVSLIPMSRCAWLRRLHSDSSDPIRPPALSLIGVGEARP
jgi:hypothetical protein